MSAMKLFPTFFNHIKSYAKRNTYFKISQHIESNNAVQSDITHIHTQAKKHKTVSWENTLEKILSEILLSNIFRVIDNVREKDYTCV